jgi:hypothetical protein
MRKKLGFDESTAAIVAGAAEKQEHCIEFYRINNSIRNVCLFGIAGIKGTLSIMNRNQRIAIF